MKTGHGISIPGKKGFQKSSAKIPAPPKTPLSKEEEARRRQRREAAKRSRMKTHSVILRFPHKTHADLELIALSAGKRTGTWIRERVEMALQEAIKSFVWENKVGGAVTCFYGTHGLAKAREQQNGKKKP